VVPASLYSTEVVGDTNAGLIP